MERRFNSTFERLSTIGRRQPEGEALVGVQVVGKRQRHPRGNGLRETGEDRSSVGTEAGPESDADRSAWRDDAVPIGRSQVTRGRKGLPAGDDLDEPLVGLEAQDVARDGREEATAIEMQKESVIGRAAGDGDLHIQG